MRPDAPYFIILLCLVPDDLTRQGESVATRWLNPGRNKTQARKRADHLWCGWGMARAHVLQKKKQEEKQKWQQNEDFFKSWRFKVIIKTCLNFNPYIFKRLQ